MKAALFVGVNAPISVEDVTPVPPGPRDVVLRIGASGVCHSDLSMVDGTLPCPVPAILGHEGAGTVEAVGSDVTSVKIGDRVISSFIASCGECWYCRHDLPFVCRETLSVHGRAHAHRADGAELTGIGGLGTMAEMMTVDERLVVPVRSDLPDEQLALIGCGVTTGVGAALNTAQVVPGSTVAVVGCGGVGQSVVQGSRIAGAERIIAIDPVELKRKTAVTLGATDMVDPSAGDPVEAVRELTDGRGADYVFEVVGSAATLTQSIDMTRSAGTTVLIGVMKMTDNISYNGLMFMYGGKHLVSSFGGSADPRRDFPRYVKMVEDGQILLDSMVSRRYRLAEVNDAFAATAAGEVLRGVLL
jgi:S-(hydroxymethyl)glutathione dehydrogenase / alcohol dehydrogenase